MKTITIQTEGMHCKSCEILVTEALEELSGVEKATATFDDGIIKVTFDESKVNKDKLLEIIREEGYAPM